MDKDRLKKLARQIIDAVIESPVIVEVRAFSQPDEVDKLEDRIAALLRSAPASTVAPQDEGTCTNCGGSGEIEIGCAMDHALTASCVECGGTGRLRSSATIPSQPIQDAAMKAASEIKRDADDYFAMPVADEPTISQWAAIIERRFSAESGTQRATRGRRG